MKSLVAGVFLLFSLGASANYCATVYQGPYMTGSSLYLYDGTQIDDLDEFYLENDGDQTWDNRVSSLIVEPNCKLVVYQYTNFGRRWDNYDRIGKRKAYWGGSTTAKHVDKVYGLNNMTSSLKCSCN